MARLALIAAFLGGCAKSLPPENYGITITSHVCDDAGTEERLFKEATGTNCHAVTETIPPIHDQPKR